MSSVEHIPGPWRVVEPGSASNGVTFQIIAGPDDEFLEIATTGWCDEDDLANANLISAAPDLLSAGKKLLADLHARIDEAEPTAVPVFEGIAELSAAIAKAEGGAV